MLTSEQEVWINHLSDTDCVHIIPYDTKAPEIFERIRKRIRSILSDTYPIEHHGATSLGISGQDEVDIYIPVPPEHFDSVVARLSRELGEPGSVYAGNRARFTLFEERKRIDIFPINREHENWKATLAFERHLRTHADELDRYRDLKESGNGLSVREYYRRKYEFIDTILSTSGFGVRR